MNRWTVRAVRLTSHLLPLRGSASSVAARRAAAAVTVFAIAVAGCSAMWLFERSRRAAADVAWRYVYDEAGRPITEEYPLGKGQNNRSLPNGVRTIWKYQAEGKLRAITHVLANQTVFQEFKYEYRPDGLIASVSEEDGSGHRTLKFSYDTSGRL